jgi:hypothetical protein
MKKIILLLLPFIAVAQSNIPASQNPQPNLIEWDSIPNLSIYQEGDIIIGDVSTTISFQCQESEDYAIYYADGDSLFVHGDVKKILKQMFIDNSKNMAEQMAIDNRTNERISRWVTLLEESYEDQKKQLEVIDLCIDFYNSTPNYVSEFVEGKKLYKALIKGKYAKEIPKKKTKHTVRKIPTVKRS